MIETIITPKKNKLDISVLLPNDYIDKQLHVLIYKDDEVKSATISASSKKKPSDFFGTLDKKEGEKMQKYVTKSRKEWERNL